MKGTEKGTELRKGGKTEVIEKNDSRKEKTTEGREERRQAGRKEGRKRDG